MNEILSTHMLSVGYRNGKNVTPVLENLQLTLSQGQLVCLLGANGIGKSTLLRTLSGVQSRLSGEIEIAGRSLSKYSKQELSRLISIVYTDRTLAGALTVYELVSLGRHPYTGFWGRLSDEDRYVVADALAEVGMEHKSGCHVATLSDGERQKVMIARALAQEAPIIILDEPTAFLDVASRIETMKSLQRIARSKNKAILLSSHDVGQALALADRLWLLRSDRTMVQGVTEDLVLNGELDMLFAGRRVAFDPMSGDYVAQDSRLNIVNLCCEDRLLKHWITNALERNGIGLDDKGLITVVAHSSTDIAVDGKSVGSIERLIDYFAVPEEKTL